MVSVQNSGRILFIWELFYVGNLSNSKTVELQRFRPRIVLPLFWWPWQLPSCRMCFFGSLNTSPLQSSVKPWCFFFGISRKNSSMFQDHHSLLRKKRSPHFFNQNHQHGSRPNWSKRQVFPAGLCLHHQQHPGRLVGHPPGRQRAVAGRGGLGLALDVAWWVEAIEIDRNRGQKYKKRTESLEVGFQMSKFEVGWILMFFCGCLSIFGPFSVQVPCLGHTAATRSAVFETWSEVTDAYWVTKLIMLDMLWQCEHNSLVQLSCHFTVHRMFYDISLQFITYIYHV